MSIHYDVRGIPHFIYEMGNLGTSRAARQKWLRIVKGRKVKGHFIRSFGEVVQNLKVVWGGGSVSQGRSFKEIWVTPFPRKRNGEFRHFRHF